MTHKDLKNVIVMWEQDDRKKRTKGNHKTNFNVKNGIDLNVGDLYFKGKDTQDRSLYWQVEEISEIRESSLLGYNYVETLCSFRAN